MAAPKKSTSTCPECGKVYHYLQALGRHRQSAHGVAGSSTASLYQQRKKDTHAEQEKATPRRSNPLANVTTAAVNEAARQVAENDGISDQILAVALGRFQQFCLGFAQEYDLPARMFTRRFASVIHAATIR